jgi:starvation-inducible DNA-binding protein
METRIGIKQDGLKAVAHVLAKILADEFVLSTKTRNAHWNVEGPDFYDKHKFFEFQYSQMDDILDQVAERIRALGHYAPATLKQYLELTQFTEELQNKNDSQGFIKELLIDHENIIIELRENIEAIEKNYNDVGSSDFLIGLIKFHETAAWMLRIHIR